ncbi:riboflavin synthase domain-like protein [Xylariomycetidae sp. FL0641]|nr:riboflavin synthase domain-like protein [Xylariomycetidae sp. FL0641]
MSAEQLPALDDQEGQLRDRHMLLLYGSETGNSQDAAENIEQLAARLRFRTQIFEMNDVDLSTLTRYPLIIFIVSTTGQGDLPRNALALWKSLLRKRLPPNCLAGVSFTTFGLGDSSYTSYNFAVRKLDKRLRQLGAVEFFPRGEGDERHEDGIDGTFLPWSISLRSHLQSEYPLPEGISPIPDDVQLPPKFTLVPAPAMACPEVVMTDACSGEPVAEQQSLDGVAARFSHVDDPTIDIRRREHELQRRFFGSLIRDTEATANGVAPKGVDYLDRFNVLKDDPAKYSLTENASTGNDRVPEDLLPIPLSWTAYVDENHRVTPHKHWQDVRLLSLVVLPRSNSAGTRRFPLEYRPGDTLTIYPKNFPSDVQALIDLMGWGEVADTAFEHQCKAEWKAKGEPCYRLPTNCFPKPRSTLRQLLTNNYDITAIPKRSFFGQIAFYSKDPMHQQRLREFNNPSYSDEFYDYTSRPRRSILEILQDFPSVQVPYQHVPAVFPVIRGREYSIAGPGDVTSDDEDADTMVVQILVALVKYKTVLRKTRQGLCSRYLEALPRNTPLVFTVNRHGAPINRENNDGYKPLLAIGPGTGVAPLRAAIHERLAMGAKAKILLFYGGRNRKADFFFEDEWKDFGNKVKVITAFSRDQEQKIYVQDRIRENGALVCEFLQRGAEIALCGSAGQMPIAVKQALYEVMVKGGLSPNIAAAKERLHRQHVFWEEVW